MPQLEFAHPAVQRWFAGAFNAPTAAQLAAWPTIARGESTLLLAPTGSGKTLAAFLVAINRIMFQPCRAKAGKTRVLYISPLKALGVDVERNLRAPIAGIRAVAALTGERHVAPSVGIRSGDTSAAERRRLLKNPPDILITTPESLFLMLSSAAGTTLSDVETVIVDEIHAVCSTKRGSHLTLSLERLESLRQRAAFESETEVVPLQRIGLSATQRPLDEVARFLGGFENGPNGSLRPRPVQIVDAGASKIFELRVEVPIEDMGQLGAQADKEAPGADSKSIWPKIHPRLLELIRSHRSTMIFANSRRLSERLAAAINELAGEEVALAHHGSISKDTRAAIEDRLKRGLLPAIVATSSLELGIDMGAVDLVIQIEAPMSVASGIQRIGRAGHQVGEVSRGILFPKFRGDLLACASVVEHIRAGRVEQSRYPRNPLDVLAQQIVAIVSVNPLSADELYAWVRRAAPFSELSQEVFEGVLDMLSGRYPSERFRELRPRLNWDRISGRLEARRGARLLAIANSGTIVDRGLYGVFLAGSEPPVRVGELDEEMVFESRTGEVFLLGASSWRIEDITHDRVLVTPAPGEPGRMPFWRGDRPGRPYEFGLAIGKLARELAASEPDAALRRLKNIHQLDHKAATNLLSYLEEQKEVSELPTDQQIVVESFTDEVGDWRVVVLTPFGGRVHAPWSTVIGSRLERELGLEVDSMWTDDGMMFRLPDSDEPPALSWFAPEPEVAKETLTQALGSTALFAAHFRENAARALLLPRRRPGQRTPLWVQRRRSSDLLKVATEFADFPIVLETYRECLQDVFDTAALSEILTQIQNGRIRVKAVQTRSASPFAATLLFSYVANFLYAADAPLAERRAQALSLDHDQLRALLGEPELRELVDGDAIEQLELQLQRLDAEYVVRDPDDLVDLLLWLGDLSQAEIEQRMMNSPHAVELPAMLNELQRKFRVVPVQIHGHARFIAVEDASRFRDALGVVLPMGVPAAFLSPANKPVSELVLRFSRCHGPFSSARVEQRYGLGRAVVQDALRELEREGQLVRGGFLPSTLGANDSEEEYCHTEVLRRLKRTSLAKLRSEIEPVEPEVFTRFLMDFHRLGGELHGLDGLLTVVEQLQGTALHFLDLESELLPARIADYVPRDMDELCAAGEVLWRGTSHAAGDARLMLFLTDDYAALAPEVQPVAGALAEQIRRALSGGGALFFDALAAQVGGFSNDVQNTLWEMVWAGEVTNDTLAPLRSLLGVNRGPRSKRTGRGFRSRRALRPGTEGRWSLLPSTSGVTPAVRAERKLQQLLRRYGVITREAVRGEGLAGGFAAIYPLLKAMEEAGRLRRGYFIAGFGATQFAAPGSETKLRLFRQPATPKPDSLQIIAATDPANPYGVCLPWPASSVRPSRVAGTHVLLDEGRLVAYVGKGRKALVTFVTVESDQGARLVSTLEQWFAGGSARAWLLVNIDGEPAQSSPWAPLLIAAGFAPGPKGLLKRRSPQKLRNA